MQTFINEVTILIVAIVVLCGILCFTAPSPIAEKLISMALTGLFGIVTGRHLLAPKG